MPRHSHPYYEVLRETLGLSAAEWEALKEKMRTLIKKHFDFSVPMNSQTREAWTDYEKEICTEEPSLLFKRGRDALRNYTKTYLSTVTYAERKRIARNKVSDTAKSLKVKAKEDPRRLRSKLDVSELHPSILGKNIVCNENIKLPESQLHIEQIGTTSKAEQSESRIDAVSASVAVHSGFSNINDDPSVSLRPVSNNQIRYVDLTGDYQIKQNCAHVCVHCKENASCHGPEPGRMPRADRLPIASPITLLRVQQGDIDHPVLGHPLGGPAPTARDTTNLPQGLTVQRLQETQLITQGMHNIVMPIFVPVDNFNEDYVIVPRRSLRGL